MNIKTIDQLKIYCYEATQQLLTVHKLIEKLEDELDKEIPAD